MALKLPSWAKDKRVQVAAGIGGALGLVALVRKRNSQNTADSAGQASGQGQAGGIGTLGAYDSSAMDAYNNFQTTLENYGNAIGDLQDQLRGMQQPSGAASTPSKPATAKPPQKKPTNPAAGGKKPLTAHQLHVLHVKHLQTVGRRR